MWPVQFLVVCILLMITSDTSLRLVPKSFSATGGILGSYLDTCLGGDRDF